MSVIKTLLTGIDNSYRSYTFSSEGAIVFLTYKCTSRCKTCNMWKRPLEGNELSWEEWKPIIGKLAQNNLRSIELFGGDALLRKDLLIKMVQLCKQVGIRTFFPTNSNLLDEETAMQLVEAGLGTIYFSLDEISSLNGSIRGVEDHFDKVNRAVQFIKKHRGSKKEPNMVCITTLSRLNYHMLDNFIEYANSIPFDMYMLRGLTEFNAKTIRSSAVNGICPEPYFTSNDSSSNLFNKNEAEELLNKLKEVKSRVKKDGSVPVNMENMDILSTENLINGSYPKMKCQFCTTQMILTPNGDVVPCLYYNKYVIGNLKKQEVKQVWGNKRHREFCAQQRNSKIDICNYCSIKFYHKSFSATVGSLFDKVQEKILASK